MGHVLARVDDRQGAVLVGRVGEEAHRRDGAQDVRDMGEGKKFYPGCEQRRKLIEIQGAIVEHGHKTEARPGALS